MVKVITQARRFAKRAAEGKGKTKATFFGGRSGSRRRLARRVLASGEPAGSTYLRDGLLVLGGVAAGVLVGRQSKRGGAQEETSIVDLPPPPEVKKADLPPPLARPLSSVHNGRVATHGGRGKRACHPDRSTLAQGL